MKGLDAARSSWKRLLEMLRTAPITEAERFVDRMRADLDRDFPRVKGNS